MGLFPGRSEAVVGGIMTTVMVPTAEASTGSIHSLTVRQSDSLTVRQTYSQTDIQYERESDSQKVRQSDSQTVR